MKTAKRMGNDLLMVLYFLQLPAVIVYLVYNL